MLQVSDLHSEKQFLKNKVCVLVDYLAHLGHTDRL